MIKEATRYHDFSAGHRVVGHENKCALLHGHNYRVHFRCQASELDRIGRVLDFGEINTLLCQWLEREWDHKFLAYQSDPVMQAVAKTLSDVGLFGGTPDCNRAGISVVWLPFNPTAENMAAHLLQVVGPQQLEGTGVTLMSVLVEETRKCWASASLDGRLASGS